MQVIIFIGIQATGKTTFYSRHFINSHVRISMDLLRTRNRERRFIELCIATDQKFLVDNTNPSIDDRRQYIEAARAGGYEVVGYYFQSPVRAALERNQSRQGRARIPDKGILGTYSRLELPSHAEGFDALFYVSITEDNTFNVDEWRDEV